MNSKILPIIIIAALLIGGYFVFISPNNNGTDSMSISQDTEKLPVSQDSTDTMDKDAMENENEAQMAQDMDKEPYVEFSAEELEMSQKEGRTLLFFYASWCPTCKAAETEIKENTSKIPEGVKILKTNFDKETDLKKKYGVTYQHTFVQVDKNGEMITKWSGGGVDTIIENIE